jgi:hypothetical protein
MNNQTAARAAQASAEEEGEADILGVDSALLKRLLRAAAAREVAPSRPRSCRPPQCAARLGQKCCSLECMACPSDWRGHRERRGLNYVEGQVVGCTEQGLNLHALLTRL